MNYFMHFLLPLIVCCWHVYFIFYIDNAWPLGIVELNQTFVLLLHALHVYFNNFSSLWGIKIYKNNMCQVIASNNKLMTNSFWYFCILNNVYFNGFMNAFWKLRSNDKDNSQKTLFLLYNYFQTIKRQTV